MAPRHRVETTLMEPNVAVGEHASGDDTIIVGGNLVITRDEVLAGYWVGEALRRRSETLAAAFRSAVIREIAAKGWA